MKKARCQYVENILKMKSIVFNVHFEYEIIEILDNNLIIKNISSDDMYEVALK